MRSNEDISKELERISSLVAGIKKVDFYSVPEGYFAQFPNQLLSLLQDTEVGSNEINCELDTVAPLLNTIHTKQVQTVPSGYFDQANFAFTVLKSQKKPAIIIGFFTAKKWLQIAAAAIITGILITGAFIFTDDNVTNIEYEEYAHIDLPVELNKVSEVDIEKYLTEPVHSSSTPSTNVSYSEENLFDVNTAIQLFSDEELTRYLSENAEPSETISVSKK